MFQGKHPWGNTKPFSVEPFGRRPFSRAPADSILHWDADIDAFSEQTGGVHRFNHSVLSPQYQLNADGSYSNVGAKPAVDVFGGQNWLRSCGAVQNLLTNSVFAGAVSGTPGTAPTGWNWGYTQGSLQAKAIQLTFSCGDSSRYYLSGPAVPVAANTTYVFTCDVIADGSVAFNQAVVLLNPPAGSSQSTFVDGVSFNANNAIPAGSRKILIILSVGATAGVIASIRLGLGCSSNQGASSVTISNPQLTASAYPQPYVPTTPAGPVTQPASNATATNGSWFSLPDGSELWKALTGSPVTLATLVMMGVSSASLPPGDFQVASCLATGGAGVQGFVKTGGLVGRAIQAFDGTLAPSINAEWTKNAIIRRVTQVNAAGTQFRVGYMVEGTHTTIQWSGWVAFDGSFGPSTLYRLMLGYNNAYPMWFSRITAWKEQVSDDRILEALNG